MVLQEAEVAPIIADYWERAEFPHHLVPKLAKLNLSGATLQGNGCPGQSILAAVSMPTTHPASECTTLVNARHLRAGILDRSLDVAVHVQPFMDIAPLYNTCNQGSECSTCAAKMWRKARLTVFVQDNSRRGVFVKQLKALNSISFCSGRQCQWSRWHV